MSDGELASASGRRGRGLSVERIARAALELIDEKGVGAASMRAIGARLGVEAMSLYNYVANRDELLDAVVELVVQELDDDPSVSQSIERGWREHLTRLAHGVRRYARAHPHAFPLIATRPAEAPWVNPPLRSVRWIESMLKSMVDDGFTDGQVLFSYRSFNSFLLGYLLMETGAMTVLDPKDGDGSIAPGVVAPGGLSPTRSDAQSDGLARSSSAEDVLDPENLFDAQAYPHIHRLARGLAEDHFTNEFDSGLSDVLDRIAMALGDKEST